MKYTIILISLVFFILSSCEKEVNPIIKPTYKTTIKAGKRCGWCSYEDSLIITKEFTRYDFFKLCKSDYIIDTITDSNTWNTLISLLDYDKFNDIDINTCNYCTDGCDSWILININNQAHYISYGFRDSSTIESIKPFVDEIINIKEKLKK